MSFSSRARASASSIFLPSNLIVWLSAIVVLGIVAYWFSAQNQQPDSIVYMLVVVGFNLLAAVGWPESSTRVHGSLT